jgi:hypothetical protein
MIVGVVADFVAALGYFREHLAMVTGENALYEKRSGHVEVVEDIEKLLGFSSRGIVE